MLIGEVCRVCKITKKAVEYYEQQGFIQPAIMENGYRNYTEQDLSKLKEITMLRRLDISIADIKLIVFSPDKGRALADYRTKREIDLVRAQAQYDVISRLIASDYDVDAALEDVDRTLDPNTVIQDKLSVAFPGSFGEFLNLHFGKFLNEPIETPEQAAAYRKIVGYLDTVKDFDFSPELEAYFARIDEQQDKVSFAEMDQATAAALDDYSGYMEQNQAGITQYLAFRNSEAYRSSPLFEMQQAMVEFQQSSGYAEVFLTNMSRLSASYATYMQKLQTANEQFIARFPEAADLYDR